MTIWPPKRQDLRRPTYRSLADSVVSAVRAGELRSGDRLPTHRQLAYDLGVSVQTVSRAYEDLIRRGIIAGEVGRGTYVRAVPEETRTPYLPERQYGAIIDCSMLKPVFDDLHDQAMRRMLRDLGEKLPASVVSSFRPSVAWHNCRPAALRWLSTCGVDVANQGVLLTNGSTSAMSIALMTGMSHGDLMLTEDLTHHTLKPLADYLGVRARGVEADDQGMVPEALERACQLWAPKLIYLMPTGLNPRALVMSRQRREQIVDIARRYNLVIVENDAWGPLHPARPDPVVTLAPERTFYFTSLSKCLMPGIRMGFLVVPETYESAAANRHLVTNWSVTPLMAEISSRWIMDGTAERFVAWQRDALEDRNIRARRLLQDMPIRSSPSGMHVWMPIPAPWSEDDFVAHARLHGVAVAPGGSFAIERGSPHAGVRICLGAATVDELELGLKVLSRLARSRPEPALLTI
ncbi:MAG: PLP-dependent aminotransferase family protein [Devosia sp.]|uniref:MocR-like ectoine utilization transcription factor EhuR n=1 Tax=Devosia sp. TaxID=1871048 RepID=UPI0024CCEFDE|nr:PLP-dependent aminotransferase family protein [Devosia sp.]UYN98608.1 MAG: PLP-dependent aminotransferase family protein [Devosia sp.]